MRESDSASFTPEELLSGCGCSWGPDRNGIYCMPPLQAMTAVGVLVKALLPGTAIALRLKGYTPVALNPPDMVWVAIAFDHADEKMEDN